MIQKRECRKSMMSTRWINIITPRFFFILIVCNQNNSKILSFGICWPCAAYREKFIIFIRTIWIVFFFFYFAFQVEGLINPEQSNLALIIVSCLNFTMNMQSEVIRATIGCCKSKCTRSLQWRRSLDAF